MKTFLLSVTMLVAVSTAVAQRELSYGIIGGYNLSKVANVGGDGIDVNRPGFHIGGIVEFPINEKWSWEATLAYSEEGENFTIDNVDTEFKYTNINLPVQAKYYIIEGLSVHAGPQIGFITKIEETVDDGPTRTIKDRVNSHFAFTGGFGYDTEMGLFAKASLAYGFTDTIDNIDFTNKEYIGTIHFSLGYKF